MISLCEKFRDFSFELSDGLQVFRQVSETVRLPAHEELAKKYTKTL
jgi:hypothetical protein